MNIDLWRRRPTEFLTVLRSGQGKQDENTWPVIGELVLTHDNGPGIYWKLGTVSKLFKRTGEML